MEFRDRTEVLGEGELQEYAQAVQPAHFLAKRFAAKEALAKALGTGIGAVSWQDFAVLPQPGGAPQVHSHGRARKLFAERGVTGVWISLSDEREQALAFALLSGG
jgi:holo-[acyl-carrier protein] synthase